VGRPATLTGDPLRLAAPVTVPRAVQRLEREASTAWPLGAADRGLAALTCARFDALLAPPRGDDALAAALARYGADSDTPVTLAPLALRDRLERIPRGLSPVASTATRSPLHVPRPKTRPVEPQVDPSSGRGGGRAVATSAAASTPRSETGGSPAAQALGLEWFTAASPRVREAAHARLDVEPGAARPSSTQQATAGPPRASGGNPSAGGRPPSSPSIAEAVPRLRDPSTPTASDSPLRPVETARHSAKEPAVVAGSGLESLVRAWNVTQPEDLSPEADLAEPEAVASVAFGERPVEDAARNAPQPGQPSVARLDPVSEEELLDLRDEVGRMLVAELRRYGIEVGP
jgi:hypothetical protein